MFDPYRKGVGVMLLNAAGLVWVGQRLDSAYDAWQMPQGGLDEGEDALDGAYRELEEETGIARRLVRILARSKDDFTYELPEELVGKVWKEPWRGQRQIWFVARFLGRDEDVAIDTPDPEFRAWKWVEPAELPGLIVPFKRKLYENLVQAFAEWLQPG
ncbi:MAG: RNA pyrophosphohydrolase [Sphingosinicella sp.]